MGKLEWRNRAGAVVLLCATAPIALSAQTFKTVHRFHNTDGGTPLAGLVQSTGGNLYGTTSTFGANGGGTVFKITPGGTLTTLYSFCSQSGCTDGAFPEAPLVQATNGNFYGTTSGGNSACAPDGCGTVFKIAPSGTLTTLYRFCAQGFPCTDGGPPSELVQATGGNFYGTTGQGGANGEGTVFKITPSGTLTTLYSFCSQSDCTDGAGPNGGLVQATGGNFYGTTGGGGANGWGTVFKITPSGRLTTLYSFCSQSGCTDGREPGAALVQATDGNLYGTTKNGGANTTDCNGSGCGTVFKITPSGTLTTLYSFCSQSGCTDGWLPHAALVQASDGNLYGTTPLGGSGGYDGCTPVGCGTVFKITPSGTLTTLHSFCSEPGCSDGQSPGAATQDTNGNLYGTTAEGGGTGRFCGGGCGRSSACL